jgi:ABC-type transporter Mla MlaB component
MPEPVTVPADFNAIVFTPPPHVHHEMVTAIQHAAFDAGLPELKGHRIVHMRQLESIDTAAVAGLMTIFDIASSHAMKFLICDPPPMVCSYLELYGAKKLLENSVVYSDESGMCTCDHLPFVPPFVPWPVMRFDAWQRGKCKSYELRKDRLHEIPPANLVPTAMPARTRATSMIVKKAQDDEEVREEIAATGYVYLRRHECAEGETHLTFRRLYRLHGWYRDQGFDFAGLELLVGDHPAGVVIERFRFNDRAHHEQFQAWLNENRGWEDLPAPAGTCHEETCYLYA